MTAHMKDHKKLCTFPKDYFDHQKNITLPLTQDEW